MESYTAFAAGRKLAAGPLAIVAPQARAAYDAGVAQLLIFDDASGRPVDLDLRGDGKLAAQPQPARGRPKLGVTAREVTLLPSHWDWLAGQPGGASAALRRLVDQARRSGEAERREARDSAYRVMSALGGNLPGFEEASRALFASDYSGFAQIVAGWPADIAEYVAMFVVRLRDVSLAAPQSGEPGDKASPHLAEDLPTIARREADVDP